MFSNRRSALALRAASVFAAALATPAAWAQGFVPPPNANIVNVQSFGAVANDGGDDLPAFTAALAALVGSNTILYVPDGVYEFSDRLHWASFGNGGGFTLQGQSRDGTILRLRPNAPGFQFNFDDADGDTIADDAKPFIDAYEGNTANQFRTYLRDLTIEVGAGNPGAIGLEFQSNNTGRIENVTVRSIDPAGAGATGLNQGFNFPGPLLIRNLTIEGFDTGYVGAPQEYNAVFENLTLRNQRVLGFYVWRLPVQIRNLVSENRVPVLRSDANPGAWGHVVIDGATLTGLPGAESVDAIINTDGAGTLLLRNVTATGYRFAVSDFEVNPPAPPAQLPGPFVAQYSTEAPATLNPSTTTLLDLPVPETPEPPAIPLSEWVSVKTFGAVEDDNLDDTEAVRAAFRSGASVVYFPSGLYYLSDTIDVGPTVRRIEGFMSEIRTNAPLATEDRPMLRIGPDAQPQVHVSGLNASFQSPGFRGGGVWIEQATPNTLIVRDGDLNGYRNTAPGGRLFLENIVGNSMVFTGQQVYARQLNPEGSQSPHVRNVGGDVYVLGLKTEGEPVVFENLRGARSVVLGGLVYPSTTVTDRTRPMAVNSESSLAWSMPESCYLANGWYAVWVRETRAGVTTDFTRAMLPAGRGHSNCGGQIALYNSLLADASPPLAPSGLSVDAPAPNTLRVSWSVVTDPESGVAFYDVFRDGLFVGRTMQPDAGAGVAEFIDARRPDGAVHSYTVSAVNGVRLATPAPESASGQVPANAAPPRVTGVRTGLDPRFITVFLSEPVEPVSAQTVANFTLEGPAPASVIDAALDAQGRTLTLRADALTPGAWVLRAQGVTDRGLPALPLAPLTRVGFTYDPLPTGTGLTAEYFLSREFIGAPILTRVEGPIDFPYGTAAPAPGVPADGFAVRWSGSLQPARTEPYTIFARSDDGVRVFLDGVLLIDQWRDQGATEVSATATLDASRTHDLVVEYYENTGGAEMRLSWESAGTPKQVIPAGHLLPQRRLTSVRTLFGQGADAQLDRFGTADGGAGQSIGAFHSPASGGFHDAGYYRIDLSPFDAANRYVVDGVATLSQTFFGIGSGRRELNVFTLRQSANADAWIETGPGHVTWDTAPGNDNSGALADVALTRWLDTFLLDNAGFQNNNRPDKIAFGGPRLLEAVRDDADGLLTFLFKRVDASNEGQSFFTKEWTSPQFSPALKLFTLPDCPAVVQPPLLPAADAAPPSRGQTLTLNAFVRGEPPLTVQWLRNGEPLADGPGPGGTLAGATVTITEAAERTGAALTIAQAQGADSGIYTFTITNACGSTTSDPITLTLCAADFNSDNTLNDDDLGEFITAYFEIFPGPDGYAAAPCDGLDAPYDTLGYRADFTRDCSLNDDDLGAFITAYFLGCE